MRSDETFFSHKMLPLSIRQNLIETLRGFDFKKYNFCGRFSNGIFRTDRPWIK